MSIKAAENYPMVDHSKHVRDTLPTSWGALYAILLSLNEISKQQQKIFAKFRLK